MRRRLLTVVWGCLGIALAVTPAIAHVDYVTEGDGDVVDVLEFLFEVLSAPLNALLVGGGLLGLLVLLGAYFRYRPVRRDVTVFRDTLAGYGNLVPWMLRLSVGLPLVGAGFGGYLFSPAVTVPMRQLQVLVGFLLLFGLATRAVALVGLGTYLGALLYYPDLLLAFEYVPGFIAIALLGGGRPSADHVLQQVASAPGTLYGEVDPIHRIASWLNARTEAYVAYAPTVLRFGLGATFVYLGLTQKLADPAGSLAVVEKYQLTAIVPVDPGLWVVGAGFVEIGVGMALVAGLFTRASAATAFLMLSLTLFGLPDDPVLAHVTLFGMTSALVTVGAGPLSLDNWLQARDENPLAGSG